MTWVGLVDVPAMVLAGAVSAFLVQRSLGSRSADWYPVLTALATGLGWLGLVAANVPAVPYWGVGLPAVAVSPAIAIPYGLAYPLWIRAGGEAVFLLVGRRPDQGGLVWVFRLDDRTAPITPAWRDRTGPTDRRRSRVAQGGSSRATENGQRPDRENGQRRDPEIPATPDRENATERPPSE